MSDDDDDDDDDNGGGETHSQPRQQQNRGRDNKKSKGQSRDVDLSSDPSFGWRFLKTTISAFANDVGKMGYAIPAIHVGLNTIEAVLGKEVTSMGLNALAAAIQNPKFVKDWIRSQGLPEQVNALGDEFIDDVIEGLRMALRGDKFNPDVGNKAVLTARKSLATRAGALKVNSFEDAFMLLDPNEQANMDTILTALALPEKVELRKQFDAYRPKLASVVAQKTLLRCVIKGTPPSFTTDDVVAYLKRTYGEIKPPSDAVVVVKKIVDKVTAKFGEALKSFTDHPEQTFTEIAQKMDEQTQQAQPADQLRRDRLEALKKQR